MSVIPLTLVISLCLAFTFVLFFLREQSRRRFSSAESEALLPLADEIAHLVPAKAKKSGHSHGGKCGCQTGERDPCSGCLRRNSSAKSQSQS